jgi:predicted permease
MLLDLKIALRGLRARPLFTVVALATLAVGIGANAAVFSILHAVLIRPLPFPGGDRLVALHTRYLPATGYDFPYFAISGPELADLQNRVRSFSTVAGYQLVFRNVTSEAAEAERVLTMAVTPEFFAAVGVQPARGRAFTKDEARGACVAVLRHDLFEQRFPDAMRSGIRLDDTRCEIVGVMPDGFSFRDDRIRIWTALAPDTSEAPFNRESHGLAAVARLQEGITATQAEAELQSLRRQWSERFPDHYARGHFAVFRPLREDIVGDQRTTLLLLGAAVGFVLLIVCANLAGLLVSRSVGRRREFAVRRALGANRARLIRQILSEAMVLAAAGGLLGLLVADWVLTALLALYPERLPVPGPITIDHRALLCALTLTVTSGILVGILPALHASGGRLQETLKIGSLALTAGRRGVASRSMLVAGQIALSVTLLVSALLLIRTYSNLQSVDLGFDAGRLLTFFVSVPPGREPDAAAARRQIARIQERLATLAGVETAAAISNLPMVSAGPPDDFTIDGRPDPAPGSLRWNARYILATPSVFEALRVPLKRGRLLLGSDTREGPLVAVINETAARLYWPGEDPVGRTIRYYPRETSPSIRIVGVVGDVRSLGAAATPPPAVYVPLEQSPRPGYEGRGMTFVIRTQGDPEALAPATRAAVASIEPGLPLANLRPMESITAGALGQPRFTNLVMTCLALIAVFLSGLGLYGVVAYNVEQRTREIGLRMALGAGNIEILRLVVSRGLTLAALGTVIGIPAAFALSRLIRGLLYGVTAADKITYATVVGILAAAALLASYLPARRAMRVDPVVALRTE